MANLYANPILKGFNPDPCLCRKGDDYYIAVSSFEWYPGIPIYHSKDMKNFELYTHVLQDESSVSLINLPPSKGIWAPCLTYDEKEDLFYVVYGIMNSMNARYFDVDNYVICARDIKGPWSKPVYLHSAGFDASILHDDNGKKYIVSLEWETRDGYEKPGSICLCEYDSQKQKIVGPVKRIYSGGTDRGCIEAPHLTKHNGYYYLMCAEGGTGYNHCVTMARAKNVFGPYEGDPKNPIVTSQPAVSNERHDPDHLKPQYYNPDRIIQKSGHGSYVETALGEVYLAHLCSRPFITDDKDIRTKYRCTLGRETAFQKMHWTDDGWLRMTTDTNLAEDHFEGSALPEVKYPQTEALDDFDSNTLGINYYSPRIAPSEYADLSKRAGYLRIRGQESLSSLHKVSFIARKLTSVECTVTCKMDFSPKVYQHSAGLVIYYDHMDYIFLRKYYSQSLEGETIGIVRLKNGERFEYRDSRVKVEKGRPLFFRMKINGRKINFYWAYADCEYSPSIEFNQIGRDFDSSELSDEFCSYGEFTGTFVGMTCVDRLFHKETADFDFFEYIADEKAPVS